MTSPAARPVLVSENESDFSLLSVGSALLRRRRLIIALGVLGGVLGLVRGLTSPRMYESAAIFIPQTSEGGGMSGLAAAASQFGISVPSSGGGGWGPPVYVALLTSRALLEPIARDTVQIIEEGGRRVAVSDLLEVKAPTSEERIDRTVRALQLRVTASEVKPLNAVKVAVSTKWPSVSLALADRLVHGINQFNLETRKSQATAERQFVDGQAAEAERALRETEDQLRSFLQRNRGGLGAPELSLERERLQREVGLRQQAYSQLIVSRGEARIREVRDTPVITVLEAPRRPLMSESRRSAQRAVLGGLAGGMIGVLIALVMQGMGRARQTESDTNREFFELLHEATPRVFRRGER